MLFTDRGTLLEAALARYRPGGRTALYDAVIAGLDRLESASNQKRVLVVLSDGEDNASRYSRNVMLDRARASNTMVYTVSNANRYGDVGGGDPGLLRRLASVTGGMAYFPDSDREVVESLDRIAAKAGGRIYDRREAVLLDAGSPDKRMATLPAAAEAIADSAAGKIHSRLFNLSGHR